MALSEAQTRRLQFAYSYYDKRLKQIADWTLNSNEEDNFTYDVTVNTKAAFIGCVSTAVGRPMGEISAYIEEPYHDSDLTSAVTERTASRFNISDPNCFFGRRLAWYAVARALKPKVIMETGVDKGLGSILLAAALKRNAADGHSGHHYGTDINPEAGFLVHGSWAPFSTMLYGDSLARLEDFDQPIDLFINDSDHSAEYEAKEYEMLPNKLAKDGIVLGDNSHVTDALFQWSMKHDRQYLFCPEYPKDHWYPGAGIGFSFPCR